MVVTVALTSYLPGYFCIHKTFCGKKRGKIQWNSNYSVSCAQFFSPPSLKPVFMSLSALPFKDIILL